MGPGPRIRMVLMSVRLAILAPVFHASKGGKSFVGFGAATTALVRIAFLPTARGRVRPIVLPLKKAGLEGAGILYSSTREGRSNWLAMPGL